MMQSGSRLSPYSYAVRVLSGSCPEAVKNTPTCRTLMPKTDSVGLFWSNQAIAWEQPFKSIPRMEARSLKVKQQGKFVRNGTGFQLKAADPCRSIPNVIQPTKEDMGKRDGLGRESCIVGEFTMFQFVLGIQRAVAVVNAWA